MSLDSGLEASCTSLVHLPSSFELEASLWMLRPTWKTPRPSRADHAWPAMSRKGYSTFCRSVEALQIPSPFRCNSTFWVPHKPTSVTAWISPSHALEPLRTMIFKTESSLSKLRTWASLASKVCYSFSEFGFGPHSIKRRPSLRKSASAWFWPHLCIVPQ